MNQLNADTITDEQIRKLQMRALETNNPELIDLCRHALGVTPTIAWNFPAYGARARCADVINLDRTNQGSTTR